MTTAVHLVPHTHWDREWHAPFQSFRLRLVELMDGLLDLMEAHQDLVFTLDGQTAVVDDYLEVRPEAEERIRPLVGEGRLAVGPWKMLMDEFLVSGESIVRNLQAGWRRAEELGRAMPVGYLPDMFGHIAQMPQILHRAGIQDAVVWRGVPAAVDRHAFAWEAPDGSTVRAEYLPGGYGNAAYLLHGPRERLAGRIDHFGRVMAPFFGEDDLLAMHGTDHAAPLPDLLALLRDVNRRQDRYVVGLGTLAGYLARFEGSTEGLARWRGELRSGARANLLMGVTSARMDLKAACARAERTLERYAETLQALHGGSWPEELLRLAWDNLVANSAHDSICGCSVDEVAAQVLVRYAEAEQIGRGLADRAGEAVGARLPQGWTAVLNPSPHLRVGLVELSLLVPESWSEMALEMADGTIVAVQELDRQAPVLLETDVPAGEVAEIFTRRMHGRELFGRQLNGYRLDVVEGRLTLEVDREPDPAWLDTETLAEEVARHVEASGKERWKLRIAGAPRRTLRAMVTVPPLGWSALRVVEGAARPEQPVVVDDVSLDNSLLRVDVNSDGTLNISGNGVTLAGVGRLVEGGDAGDSYNYAPPEGDRLVNRPGTVEVRTAAPGPVTGSLEVVRSYTWPQALEESGQRSDQLLEVEVTTTVELRAGEPFGRLRVSFENPCRDHRLRLHVPLPHPVDRSWAEGQFAVVERGLSAEGGHGEVPLPTFPARGLVAVDGVALLLDHVMEYEVVEGRELALTLLRSIGLISRNANPNRQDPAGPEVAIPGAQQLGPWSVGVGVYPFAGSWVEAGVVTQMEQYQHPFLVAPGTGTTASVDPPTGLAIEGEGVLLSSLRRRGDWLEMRVVNQHPRPVIARVRGAFERARKVDLIGRPGEALAVEDGKLELMLSPWEITTVQLAQRR